MAALIDPEPSAYQRRLSEELGSRRNDGWTEERLRELIAAGEVEVVDTETITGVEVEAEAPWWLWVALIVLLVGIGMGVAAFVILVLNAAS